MVVLAEVIRNVCAATGTDSGENHNNREPGDWLDVHNSDRNRGVWKLVLTRLQCLVALVTVHDGEAVSTVL